MGDVRTQINIVWDGVRMHELLHGMDGPVVLHLIKLEDEIIARARPKIRRRFVGPLKAGGGGVTLENALLKRFVDTDAGPTGSVVAARPYATWVHEGNKSNRGDGYIWPIRSSNLAGTGPAMLRFVAPGGGFIFARKVKESKPNPFLRDAMLEVIR